MPILSPLGVRGNPSDHCDGVFWKSHETGHNGYDSPISIAMLSGGWHIYAFGGMVRCGDDFAGKNKLAVFRASHRDL